jgi:hypothetical protein
VSLCAASRFTASSLASIARALTSQIPKPSLVSNFDHQSLPSGKDKSIDTIAFFFLNYKLWSPLSIYLNETRRLDESKLPHPLHLVKEFVVFIISFFWI